MAHIEKEIDNGVVNVKAFGAKGDGTTDDTVSIQNAINHLHNNKNKGTLYFPAGSYIITSELNVCKNGGYYNIVGDGRRNTSIIAGAEMESMLKLGKDNSTHAIYRISDIRINLSTHALIGIDARYVNYSTVENCYF